MKRAKTGIKNFDEIVEGGFPEKSNIVVCGTPGTGKTIFGLQFLYNGAANLKEPGLFVSMEQKEKNLIDQYMKLGMNVKKLIKQNKIRILHVPAGEIDSNIYEKIYNAAKEIKAKRLVIDSLSFIMMGSHFFEEGKYKINCLSRVVSANSPEQFVYNFIHLIEELNCSTIFITNLIPESYETEDGISEYISDGVIVLRARTMGLILTRTLEVIKMRLTELKGGIYTMKISNNGIEIEK